MIHYELGRLGSREFEHLVQALMTGIFGVEAKIYGTGSDGQREAVIEAADRDVLPKVHALGRTIVQAKYKDPDTKTPDWDWLRANLKEELDGFREKARENPAFVAQTYLFFTNIILTPALEHGIKDRADRFAAKYQNLIPNIYILGSDELRAMLDNNPGVVRRYTAFLTPGDVLADMQSFLSRLSMDSFSHLLEYARQTYREDSATRLEQAGSVSEKSINIRNIYTDLEAKELSGGQQIVDGLAAYIMELGDRSHRQEKSFFRPAQREAPENRLVLLGDAGRGKSTFCQYVCQLYRAALLRRYKPEVTELEHVDAGDAQSEPVPRCERFPVLIRLKNYAAWLNGRAAEKKNASVLAYIVSRVNEEAMSSLRLTDVRELLSAHSWIFCFDGLDEVPASSNRGAVLEQIQIFVNQDLREADCDSLIVCTSRPQGYDEAFSRKGYRHFSLQEMSRPRQEIYVDRLLRYLEENRENRTQYRAILRRSMDDPMIARLMATPLYAAILVILVKAGGTPPTRRYELFEQYCQIVVKREKQKELLPMLNNDEYWIMELHAEIGFHLQLESESAENAAAELSENHCRKLIEDYLTREGLDTSRTMELYQAVTQRLPFLAETTGADRERCVLFPLRPIQEFFAAERLIKFPDENLLSSALQLISRNAYWRNVYLFVAGYFSMHSERRNIYSILYQICRYDNGDSNSCVDESLCEPGEETCFRIARPGARLALEFLCDDLFPRRNGQTRYLDEAALLLSWDIDSGLIDAFLRLPDHVADCFLRDYAIPHVKQAKRADDMGFASLWALANRKNKTASAALEELADELPAPTKTNVRSLLRIGFEYVGARAFRRIAQWVSEKWPDPFVPGDQLFWRFLSEYMIRYPSEPLPNMLLRSAVYQAIFDNRYIYIIKNYIEIVIHSLSKIQTISEQNSFFMRFLEDKELRRRFFWNDETLLSFSPIIRPETAPSPAGYSDVFESSGFPELAALAGFLHAPSSAGLKRLLEEYQALPASYRYAFSILFCYCNWLLGEISSRLWNEESPEKLIDEYDETQFTACLRKEEQLIRWINEKDFASLTRNHALGKIMPFHLDISVSQLRDILDACDEQSLDDVASVLFHRYRRLLKSLPEFSQFIVQRFFDLCASPYGVGLVFQFLADTPIATLLKTELKYPRKAAENSFHISGKDKTFRAALKKLEQLTELDDGALEAYALLPACFSRENISEALHHLRERAIEKYAAIHETGNPAARLGCLLVILTGPIPETLKSQVEADVVEMLPILLRNPDWFSNWSPEAMRLAYRTAEAADGEPDTRGEALSWLRDLLVKSIQSRQVDRNWLEELDRRAYG